MKTLKALKLYINETKQGDSRIIYQTNNMAKKLPVFDTVKKIELDTVNRGKVTFVISQTIKGFFAHEIGELTQWAKVFGGEERKAHRINPTRGYLNQYGRWWREVPLKTIEEAMNIITERAQTHVQYF